MDGWMDGWIIDKNVNMYIEMQCKSLWIKESAKCINVKCKIIPA